MPEAAAAQVQSEILEMFGIETFDHAPAGGGIADEQRVQRREVERDAPERVAGRVEPVFVDDVARLPQAIADLAQDGDVVLCMGAGSIGAVPGKVLELLQNHEHAAQGGRA